MSQRQHIQLSSMEISSSKGTRKEIATRLRISQQTASTRLRRLEAQLACQLSATILQEPLMNTYRDWFTQTTGFGRGPRDWQAELALPELCTNRLIRIPTGLGKTEGVLGAWLYHAVDQHRSDWLRRVVWCLPMRVLVEQRPIVPVT